MAMLRVTQVRSTIGTKPKQRGTMRALGLSASTTPSSTPTARRSAAWSPGCPTSSKSKRSAHEGPRPETGPRGQDLHRRRVGRGIAGKGGKTAGRGTKGQGARNNIDPGFEGGQTPLHRRTPKAKGFKNPFRVEYVVVNLDTLDALDAGADVDPGVLRSHGLVAKRGTREDPRSR